jgi:hypothetical protein
VSRAPRGHDRIKTAGEDKRQHRRRLAARRTEHAVHYQLGEPMPRDAAVLERLGALLEHGLGELASLRRRYGDHRDFDLVERGQRRLLAELREAARA